MPAPGEHKTVQARNLKYAQEIGWTYVPRAEAERRRGFSPHPNPLPATGARECAVRTRKASLFRSDLLHQLMTAQIRVHDIDFSDLGVDCETRDRPKACQLLAGG